MKKLSEIIKEEKDSGSHIVKMNVSLLIRLMEYAREDIKDDMEIHHIAEKAMEIGGVLSMDDYEELVEKEESDEKED